MKRFTAIVERDPETSLLVGYIPGLAGAHTQAGSLDELHENLKEVLAMLLEDGDPILDSEFVGIQEVVIA
jgi:predicted RNase H-like HicB family nuclease